MIALVVHGGAGNWDVEREALVLEGVKRAVRAGIRVLQAGGNALDAATAAVVVLEDDRNFNAGTGSTLNVEGEAEMDACVMDGALLRAGAVACLSRVKNPILVARQVMEHTEHVMLSGEGAKRFARAMGFFDYDPVTAERRSDYKKKRKLLSSTKMALAHSDLLTAHPELGGGTVGAVALDEQGGFASATSTGGVSLKLCGRIGDTPIPGAGTYATPHAAASATGNGEFVMRHLTTKTVCDLIESGATAKQAAARALSAMAGQLGSNVGIIAVDARGGIGTGHRTEAMPHAFFHDGRIIAAMRASEEF
jgi:beta-aspartyl-peptidase (threonine type)